MTRSVKVVNQHPLGLPATLAGGGVLAVGDVGTADPDAPQDAAMLASGVLRRAETIADLRALAKDLGIDRRTQLTRPELEAAIAAAERSQADADADPGA